MTEPAKNYRVGWVIPNQVAALTHYTSSVTPDEFMAIMGETQALLQSADQPFHLIIDNYNIALDRPLTLTELKQAAPFMSHGCLHWVVMIVPANIELAEDQQDGNQHMTMTFTTKAALDHLKAVDDTLKWDMLETDFFPHE